MCDCDFKSSSEPAGTYSPSKRVRYSMGLVLGQDEFSQEQFYFLERDRALSRLLHGYGAVDGLQVTQDGNVTKVSPGLALMPSGKLVTVPTLQCADLSAWFAKNWHEENADITPRVYVVLGYTECATDPQPVPGTACRTDEENLAPSRTTESFTLNFSLTKPDAVEEVAIRYLGALIRSIHVLPDDVEGVNTEEELLAALDAIASAFQPADSSGGQVQIEEPNWLSDGDLFYLYADGLQPALAALLHHWEAVIRPGLPTGVGAGLVNGAPDSILLGTLVCSTDGTAFTSAAVEVEESPFLVQTRLLQELLIQLARANDHAALGGLDSDDHKQYLLVDPESRALIADLDAATHTVAHLRPAAAAGEAVPFEQAIKVSDAAGGDLSKTYPNPQVIGLKSTPLKVSSLTGGDLLTYDAESKAWRNQQPVDPGATGPATGDLTGDYPAPTIQSIQGSGVSLGPELQEGQVLTWSDGAWRNQEQTLSGYATGDLTGQYPAPSIAALQGSPLQISEPQEGQALIWDSEGGRWINRNLPAAPVTGASGPAAGDLSGAYPNPTVVGLQSIPVLAGTPPHGYVLTYNGPNQTWYAAPTGDAAGPASGDLAGAYPSPSVTALQGTPLQIIEPQHGDLLVWDAEMRAWMNRVPSVPASGPLTWGIVDVNVDSSPTILASASGLEVRRLGQGLFQVLFPGFDPSLPYIVKGTPTVPDDKQMLAQFNVITPKDGPRDGITILCRDPQGAPRGFHLEISMYR